MTRDKKNAKKILQKYKWFLFVIVLVLLSIPLFYNVNGDYFGVGKLLHGSSAQNQPEVTIYFQYNVTDSEISLLRDEISHTDGVKNVVYVSSQEAAQRLFDADGTVTTDALPSSLEVYFTSSSQQLQAIVSDLAEGKAYVLRTEIL